MKILWDELSGRVLHGGEVTRDEAHAMVDSSDDELLAILNAAFQIRLKYWDRGVNLHILQNAKSGMCRENCAFCSQAIGAYSGVDRYQTQTVDELVAGAYAASEKNAVKYCMVTATRGPSEQELDTICEAVLRIKKDVNIQICTSLGLLSRDQAIRLKDAGVDRYNHNLESSSQYYPEICQTHTWKERVETIRYVKEVGMEACCGGIIGMGETAEDRVELAFALRKLEVESIPVNFFDSRPGTPLEHLERMTPSGCLKALCMFRLVNPTRDIRAAGGREVCLRHLQPFALYAANSIFTEGYLTTSGQGESEDLQMIRETGFYIREMIHEGQEDVVNEVVSAT